MQLIVEQRAHEQHQMEALFVPRLGDTTTSQISPMLLFTLGISLVTAGFWARKNQHFPGPMPIDFAEFRYIPIASLLHEFYIGHLE